MLFFFLSFFKKRGTIKYSSCYSETNLILRACFSMWWRNRKPAPAACKQLLELLVSIVNIFSPPPQLENKRIRGGEPQMSTSPPDLKPIQRLMKQTKLDYLHSFPSPRSTRHSLCRDLQEDMPDPLQTKRICIMKYCAEHNNYCATSCYERPRVQLYN